MLVNDFGWGTVEQTDSNGYAYIEIFDDIDKDIRIVHEDYVPLFLHVNNLSETLVVTLQPALRVETEAELRAALENYSGENIVLGGNIHLTSSLVIERNIAIYGGVNGHFWGVVIAADATTMEGQVYPGIYISGNIDVLLKDMGIRHEDFSTALLINISNGARVVFDMPIDMDQVEYE